MIARRTPKRLPDDPAEELYRRFFAAFFFAAFRAGFRTGFRAGFRFAAFFADFFTGFDFATFLATVFFFARAGVLAVFFLTADFFAAGLDADAAGFDAAFGIVSRSCSAKPAP